MPGYKTYGNCKTCQKTKGKENRHLRARLQRAYLARDTVGDEAFLSICTVDLHLAPDRVIHHMVNHVHLTDMLMRRRKADLTAIERVRGELSKELELSFDHDQVIPETDFERGLSITIARGIDRMEKGEITVSTTQLLQAAKIKGDLVSKKRGQDAEIIKTMYRMASGYDGKRPNLNPVTGESRVLDHEGTDRPSAVHKQSARDALTQRSAYVPVPDTGTKNPD